MINTTQLHKCWEYISVLRAMERNTLAHPDKIAISDGKRELSFRQLHETAGRYACAIRSRFSGRDRCIGVMAEQSVDTIVNLLAVLYSGNHYVMVDPQMPVQMRQALLKNAAAELLITHGDPNVLTDTAAAVLVPSELDCSRSIHEELDCDSPLFVVATSGTTGIPKIIVKSCGAMSLFIESYLRCFQLTEADVIGNATPFYSDASAKDVYAMIYGGIRMDIIPPWFFSMPFPLIARMNEKQITMISWVPSAYAIVKRFDIFRKQSLETLRIGVFIGEDIPPDTLQYWLEHVPNARFYNTYGMSELAGICAFAQLCDAHGERFSIGQPLEHCRLACVDEQNAPAVQGRLMICSEALAIGYREGEKLIPLKRTALCLPNGESGLYYDSGDLCRIDSEGSYVLLGRADHQIKHLGYRIELQGVESALLRNDNVHQAVCLFEEQTLIAVVRLNEDTPQRRQELESACVEQLPRYMRPSVFCYRNEMPLNRNGKIDRAGLKAIWKGK